MKIDVITPSGERPEALALCREYVARQTYQDINHIVVETSGTIAANLVLLLDQVTGDAVVVFEDDDWYHPKWVEYCVERLQKFPMVGELHTRYYHLPLRKHRDMETARRASLCNTAFRPEMIPHLRGACAAGHLGVDARFWANALLDGNPSHLNRGPLFYVVGMKGLPGRPGMGAGHNANFYMTPRDDNYAVLRSWVGEDDAAHYIELMKEWTSLGKIVCNTRVG